ncbi:hypothetical protein [Anabaena azotica]|uniref:Integrase n=1 Tax=Anabaena azotica FACHB-119 TaxID=947527 RepID=A0ABR8DC45_9NOST|nr:hypothetical protein [Anabaena azotica]MBD2503930.1 hypothetical protein [Anabaena azotica FACHB-119]
MIKTKKSAVYRYAKEHKQYEKFLGSNRRKVKVSQTAFRRIRRLLESQNMPITTENLYIIAKLKQEAKAHNLRLDFLLSSFLTFSALLPAEKNGQLTGEALYLWLSNATKNKPHRTTIQRWIPNYKALNNYNFYQVSIAVVHAFSYNLRSNTNGFRTEGLRSSKISA